MDRGEGGTDRAGQQGSFFISTYVPWLGMNERDISEYREERNNINISPAGILRKFG